MAIINNAFVKKPRITVDNLAEFVQSTSPSSDALSWDESDFSVTYDVPYKYFYDAIVLILGYAYAASYDQSQKVQEGYNTNLIRFLPLRHPICPWMVATKITGIQGISSNGTVETLGLQAGGKKIQTPKTTDYKIVRLVANFTNPPYQIIENERIDNTGFGTGEFARYTIYESESSAEFLAQEKGQFKFAEGPFDPSNNAFNAPYAIPELKEKISVTWKNVPLDFVCPNNLKYTPFYPVWHNALQSVNSIDFFGGKPGTVLLESFKTVRKRMPVIDNNGTDGTDWYVDITGNFIYFNPLNRYTPSDKYGHLLAPAPSGTYYYITSDGTPTGTPRFRSFDYSYLFKHWKEYEVYLNPGLIQP